VLVFGVIDGLQRMEIFPETDFGAIGRTHFYESAVLRQLTGPKHKERLSDLPRVGESEIMHELTARPVSNLIASE